MTQLQSHAESCRGRTRFFVNVSEVAACFLGPYRRSQFSNSRRLFFEIIVELLQIPQHFWPNHPATFCEGNKKMEPASLIAAFGIGSLLTVVVQRFLEARTLSRQRQYDERKEAYIGLLESWVRGEDAGLTEATARDTGHWLLRAQLVASPKVHDLLLEWGDTIPASDERAVATKNLKCAMREDLRSL